jgi:hypothetical protein
MKEEALIRKRPSRRTDLSNGAVHWHFPVNSLLLSEGLVLPYNDCRALPGMMQQGMLKATNFAMRSKNVYS